MTTGPVVTLRLPMWLHSSGSGSLCLGGKLKETEMSLKVIPGVKVAKLWPQSHIKGETFQYCLEVLTVKFQIYVCVAWCSFRPRMQDSHLIITQILFSRTSWHTRIELPWSPLPHQNECASSRRVPPFLPSPSPPCQHFRNNSASHHVLV